MWFYIASPAQGEVETESGWGVVKNVDYASIFYAMSTNVEVVKSGAENNLSLIRKFTKRVQGSGVLPRLRAIRYSKRAASPYVVKKMALKKIKRQKEVALLIKMGKMVDKMR
ncbi:MAG: hypothetical protein AAB946_01775 [Patescibacteria group bacterium]